MGTSPECRSPAIVPNNNRIHASMTSRRGESRRRPSAGHPCPGCIAKETDPRSDRLGIESLGGRSKVTWRVGSTPAGLQIEGTYDRRRGSPKRASAQVQMMDDATPNTRLNTPRFESSCPRIRLRGRKSSCPTCVCAYRKARATPRQDLLGLDNATIASRRFLRFSDLAAISLR